MQQRRKYSDEFKREAVSLANQSNVSLKQVAEELGINSGMLGRWRRELGQHGEKALKGQGNARDEEMAALKRELARVKKERDFLKEDAFLRSAEPGR
ncbi:transposase [Candidatus Thiodiazotropha endoloripes]|nr:transposase [Candidatus Thiodiazotropha endoloripes]